MGGPIARLPFSWSAITLFILAVTSAAVAFAVTAEFSKKETVRGLLRPAGGEVRILAPKGGVLRSLVVEDGYKVASGDLLAVVSTSTIAPGGMIAAEAILEAIDQQESTIEARLPAQLNRCCRRSKRQIAVASPARRRAEQWASPL